MIIKKTNLRDIEKIHLHDADFENVNYYHSENKIIINLKNRDWNNNNFILDFHNILYYEMTRCEFWGSGYNVSCWNRIDTTELFGKLLKLEQIENAKSKNKNTLMDLSIFFGIEIHLNSGDKLKILCESIEVSEF